MPFIVLTGASRGIGDAAAVAFARGGAELALVGRDPARVHESAERARAAGSAPVHEYVADLALMAEVRTLAERLRAAHGAIDVLANNAGAIFTSRRVTAEGLEQTFALNHLAPFLLTSLLRDRLQGGRVVTTSSDAHKAARLDLDDLQLATGWSSWRAYGNSKLDNILFTRELARREPGLHATCFHPGVVRTGFGKNDGGLLKVGLTLGGVFLRSPERGARSLVWLATSPDAATLNGVYVYDEKVQAPSAQAQDDDLARGLWERSEALVAVPA